MESSIPQQLVTSGPEILPTLLYGCATLFVVTAMLLAAWWFGNRRPTPIKSSPYESGILPTPRSRYSYPAPFYLVAIFFIVFDVEAVFIFTWAVAWRALGIAGLIHITIFIVILLLGLVWLWLKGGLEWGPSAARRSLIPEGERRGEPHD
jgi:NADH-quinone oxidoreductase subunit A